MLVQVTDTDDGGDQLPLAGPLLVQPEAGQLHGGQHETAANRARKLVMCINASSWFPALDEEWPKHRAQAAAMGLELRLIDPESRTEPSGATVRLAELIDAQAGQVLGLVDFRTYGARLWLSDTAL